VREHLQRFEDMGAEPLGNRRQAWDAQLSNGMRVLVLWADQRVADGRFKALQRKQHGRQHGTGPIHRLTSLQHHLFHETPLLALLAEADDPSVSPRTVKSCPNLLYRVTEVSRDETHWYVRIAPLDTAVRDPAVCRDCGYLEAECTCIKDPLDKMGEDMTQGPDYDGRFDHELAAR
jgi:hypothetical protein